MYYSSQNIGERNQFQRKDRGYLRTHALRRIAPHYHKNRAHATTSESNNWLELGHGHGGPIRSAPDTRLPGDVVVPFSARTHWTCVFNDVLVLPPDRCPKSVMTGHTFSRASM